MATRADAARPTPLPAAVAPGPVPPASVPPGPVPPGPVPAARLQLARAGGPPGLLDGAWWPRSRDLARELPALLAVTDPLLGRITHATVHRSNWPAVPAHIPVAGHVLRLGWYDSEQDADTICLLSYSAGRWDLLVVPPDSTPEAAARLMDAACAAGNDRSASSLVAAL